MGSDRAGQIVGYSLFAHCGTMSPPVIRHRRPRETSSAARFQERNVRPLSVNISTLRRLRRLIYLLIGPTTLAALTYTWWRAWQADLRGAAVGAALTLLTLGAGQAWAATLRVGATLVRAQRRGRLAQDRLDRLDAGLAGVAATASDARRRCEHAGGQLETRLAEQTRRLAERFDSLLTRVETFSKLHDEQADRLERRLSSLETAVRRGTLAMDHARIDDRDWSDEGVPPGERTVAAYHQLVHATHSGDSIGGAAPGGLSDDERSLKHALRQEFASFIHLHDYASALTKGDEIVRLFPGSAVAADFQRVRPHLLRRLQRATEVGGGQRR